MGYEINHDYTAHDGNYTPGGNSCDYIVVHNTGNTANAAQEASYAANDEHPSSYHYVLDGDEIYQLLCDTDTGWSVGAWPGCEQYIGNGESISIEVCSNGDPFTDDEIAQLGWLVRMLMDAHGIDKDHVVRHYDCHSGHKDCPAAYVDEDAWAELRNRIFDGSDERDEDEMTDEDKQDVANRVAAAVWGYQWSTQSDNTYNTLFAIKDGVQPNKPWEYVYSGDKTQMPDGKDPNGYNVLREILSEVRALKERVDAMEK